MPLYFEPWLDYQHPLVRQLAFCIASPNIISSTPSELQSQQIHDFAWHPDHTWKQHYLNYISRLKQLDLNPQDLLDFLAQLKSTRLGLRFEYLIWFWLQDSDYHCYRVMAHSYQVIEGAFTRGEMDFVLFNHDTQAVEHWEVALKYYLGESDLSLAHWYGLNRDDTLLKKLKHFCSQQFKFKQMGETAITQRYAVMKGQLYLPDISSNLSNSSDSFDHLNPMQPEPILLPTQAAWINPQRRLGQWGHRVLPNFRRLNRLEWLCPDQHTNTATATWWCNGLYHLLDKQQKNTQNLNYISTHVTPDLSDMWDSTQDYMFRVLPLLRYTAKQIT